MDDLTTYVLLGTSFFFVALSFGLLVRYRQVSQRITTSTDLGRDLWSSLEQRLKKQDERILDMMGRLEVVQSRVLAAKATTLSTDFDVPPPQPTAKPVTPVEEAPSHTTGPGPMTQQPGSQTSQLPDTGAEGPHGGLKLDDSQTSALKLLGQSPKDTRQLTDALKLSREHTARMMKELFDSGLVTRNDAKKPFVYQLTDMGRSRLPPETSGS